MSITIWGAFNNRTEHESFHLDIEGEPCCMLVHFHNPIEITVNGNSIITEPDACIIYSPGAPREYKALRGGFTNDYVKFTYKDEPLIENSGLPMNEIFYITPSWLFGEKIAGITWWLTDVMVDHREEMANALRSVIEEMSLNRSDVSPKSKRDAITAQRLRQIRSEASSSPGEWDVQRMAEAFYMTRSHFSVLYKNHFGISPGEDLHRLTMETAAALLKETSDPIEEIARKCGYSSSENFIRGFRKHFGTTPLRYRKTN